MEVIKVAIEFSQQLAMHVSVRVNSGRIMALMATQCGIDDGALQVVQAMAGSLSSQPRTKARNELLCLGYAKVSLSLL